MSRPNRAALFADVRDWAFDVNNRALAKYLGEAWQCDHFYVAECYERGWPDLTSYDAIFTPFHRWGGIPSKLMPWSKRLGSLRSRWFRPEDPGPASDDDVALVNQYAGFHVVTRANYEELRGRCPNVVYLTNPVDMETFLEPTRVRDQVVFSWNGNSKHVNHCGEDVKGFDLIIAPVMKQLGARFEVADFNTCRLPHTEMPGFYRRANVAICMSLYEGASNSIMEAMAAGLSVISTRCGNIEEIHASQLEHFGESGIVLIDRTQEALRDAMREMQGRGTVRALGKGLLNRLEIGAYWSWHMWAARYGEFFGKVLA